MRCIGFCSLLTIFFFSTSFAQVTDSDKLFKMATDYVKEKKYTEAVYIFEKLARNNEHDAQYNLAFLISSGKGITKNYSEALFWAFLAKLGKIEKAEELTEDLIDIVPEKVLNEVREKVLEHLLNRFESRDIGVLTELGDFYLLVLQEQDFENAYLWYNVASALGVQDSAEIRDKVEKASRKRYKEFTKKEATDQKKELEKTEKDYES